MRTGRFLTFIAVVVAGMTILIQHESREILTPVARTRVPATNASGTPRTSPESVQDAENNMTLNVPLKPEKVGGPVGASPSPAIQSAIQTPKPVGKEPIQDPVARLALSIVGIDPEADAYWYDAINDPTLSKNERKDLIEDLNEDGFADPDHLTLNDLPLIWSRLLLIEEVGWDAMDQVNTDAFAEAHKDLVNMYNSLAAPN